MIRGIGNRVVLNLCSNFTRVRSCGDPLEQVKTLRWLFLGKQKIGHEG